jgi:hypothetical protein
MKQQVCKKPTRSSLFALRPSSRHTGNGYGGERLVDLQELLFYFFGGPYSGILFNFSLELSLKTVFHFDRNKGAECLTQVFSHDLSNEFKRLILFVIKL